MAPMNADGEQRPYSSAVAVERAADLLFLIAERGEASLSDLGRAIGSSGSAVHRILTALKNKGLIQQSVENGPYSMSWSILALTRRMLAEVDLRSLSLPPMIGLRDLTGETVTLNVRSGFQRVCIDQVESNQEVSWRQDVGYVTPLYAGATGKVLMAYLSKADLREFFSQVKLEKLTRYTVTRRDELTKEFAQVRKQGYAIGDQDRLLGVAGIAAPIFDSAGNAAGTLTIAGPAERCSHEVLAEWVEPLTAATHRISRMVADAAIGPRVPAAVADAVLTGHGTESG
jgi:DNA-binding IclR family transcriptional regulator